MTIAKDKERVSFDAPRELVARLREIAKTNDRSVAAELKRMLAKHIANTSVPIPPQSQ